MEAGMPCPALQGVLVPWHCHSCTHCYTVMYDLCCCNVMTWSNCVITHLQVIYVNSYRSYVRSYTVTSALLVTLSHCSVHHTGIYTAEHVHASWMLLVLSSDSSRVTEVLELVELALLRWYIT